METVRLLMKNTLRMPKNFLENFRLTYFIPSFAISSFRSFRWSEFEKKFLFARSKIQFQRKLFLINYVSFFDQTRIRWNDNREISHITHKHPQWVSIKSGIIFSHIQTESTHSQHTHNTMDFQLRVILLIFNA